VDEKHVFCVLLVRSSIYMSHVRYLDLGSMINLLKGSIILDKTQHKVSSLCERFFMITYDLGRKLNIIKETNY
jgi:hypothetical protein